MDGKELNELRELVEFLKANDVAEFDMEREDLKVRLKFTSAIQAAAAAAPAGGGIDAATLAAIMASRGGNGGGEVPSPHVAPVQAQAAAAPGAGPVGLQAAGQPGVAANENEGLHMVKSPIVGTFYDAPSPGAEPFVKVGDVVQAGQVLCIVEAMKLMNEIESDAAGEVVRVVPKAGQPVEYGQELFAIKPR